MFVGRWFAGESKRSDCDCLSINIRVLWSRPSPVSLFAVMAIAVSGFLRLNLIPLAAVLRLGR